MKRITDRIWTMHAVSVSQGTVLVGAPRDDDAGLSSGAAYIYELTSP